MSPSFIEFLCVVSAESVTSFHLLHSLLVQSSLSLRSEKKELDYPNMGIKSQTNLNEYIPKLLIWMFFRMYFPFLLRMHISYN